VIATIPLGKRPRGIHASPDRKTIYVALSGSPIRGPDGRLRALSLRPIKARMESASSMSRRIRSFESSKGRLGSRELRRQQGWDADFHLPMKTMPPSSVVDIASGTVVKSAKVGAQPEGVKATPDGKFVYVTSEETALSRYSIRWTGKVVKTFKVGHRPRSVAFLARWLQSLRQCRERRNCRRRGRREAKDDSGDIAWASPARSSRWRCCFHRTASKLFVSTGRGHQILQLTRPLTRSPVPWKWGRVPGALLFSPDGKMLYSANGPSNDLSVVDVATNTVVKKVKTGASPWGVIAFRPLASWGADTSSGRLIANRPQNNLTICPA